MSSVGGYVLSVTAAGIVCGLITTFAGEKSTSGVIIKMLAGIFLAVTVVRPIGEIRFTGINDYLSELNEEARSAVAAGTQMSGDAICDIIKSQTEAYILDKAASLGAVLSVEVMVEDGSVPQLSGVLLSGQVSPYAKQQLIAVISEELGISRENQQWN